MMRKTVSSAALLLLLAAGCAHQAENKTSSSTTPSASNSGPAGTNAPSATGGPKSCNSDLDCGQSQLCIRNQCVDITPSLAECQSVVVHFQLDASDVADADKETLARSARCLRADQRLHVTIAGNADERGTEDYNLSLGDRRATSVKRYLEALGASAAQLKTVSYGKEKPLCTEHDDECWKQNRRAELGVTERAKK